MVTAGKSMCRRVVCSTCKKATWAGCGKHIDSALAGVSEADRCGGWRTGRCTSSSSAAAPMLATACSPSPTTAACVEEPVQDLFAAHEVRFKNR